MSKQNSNIGDDIAALIGEIARSPEMAELKHGLKESARVSIEAVKNQFGSHGINSVWSETYTYDTDGQLRSAEQQGQTDSQSQTGTSRTGGSYGYSAGVPVYIKKSVKVGGYEVTKSSATGSGLLDGVFGKKLPVIRRPRGKFSGSALVSMGTAATATGTGAAVLSAIGIIGAGAISGAATTALGLVALLPLGVYWLAKGSRKLGRADRFQKYVEALSAKTFCSIRELASIVKKSEKYVIRDLEKMCQDHWFYEGHMDEQKTCFIATDASYNQYLLAEQSRRELEERERQERAREVEYINHPELKEVSDTVAEGREYLRQLRAANDEIPDAEMTRKIDRMELICSKIFSHLEKHPDKLPDLRKFMRYYLPTALKLVESYKELDAQPVKGENIKKTMKEIEDSLDGIINAFENLFDQLFAERAWDVSSDISVLNTMLASEGLMGNGMATAPAHSPEDK